MTTLRTSFNRFIHIALLLIAAVTTSAVFASDDGGPDRLAASRLPPSTQPFPIELAVGDVIFIRVSAKPFREVAAATNSWTNHVGVIVAIEGNEPVIGESTFPVSRVTTLSKFIARSEGGHVAVARLKNQLTVEQQQQVFDAAKRRLGIFYDTGFDLHSRRQFCSRFVREVLAEATSVSVGEVETFSTLLARNQKTNLGFWKTWYHGSIPWERETVTPASLLNSPQLVLVFDGAVKRHAHLNALK